MPGGTARLDVETRGDGRPVVFIHGLTFDRRLLVETSEPMFGSVKARRMYVDLPGHGQSPTDERAGSAEGIVAALCDWIETACPSPPVIVGHSYGAYLALGVATQRPVAGLALVTPVIEPDVARRVVPPRRVAFGEPLVYLDGEPERSTFEEIAVVQSTSVLSAYQRLVHPASERVDRVLLDSIRARYVLPMPVLSRLAPVPMLVLCGADDHWVGYEDALPLVRAFPDVELVVLPNCGQLLPIEATDRYHAIVGGFLQRILR